jgi:phosphate transport system protein
MAEHIVRSFEDELKALDARIEQMGALAEEALARSIEALDRRDSSLAELTVRNDQAIDRLEREVEDAAISLIARRQPMANDLRQVVTAIRIAGDLERTGDLAKNIAARALAISGEPQPKQVMAGFVQMGKSALELLKSVLDAYTKRDADKAYEVWLRDEQIDAMYNSLFRELLTYMMEDPRNIGPCAHLLFGAKNLERIGDHATNIAEMTYFLVHGVTITDERPKLDNVNVPLP